MIKISELKKALGWVLAIATLVAYGYIYYKSNSPTNIAPILYSLYYIILLPILVIGLSVGMDRFEKFTQTGFKVGAFFFITVLLYTLWMGPTFWLFTLVMALVTGGLLFSLIKLSDATARLIFVLTGMVITTLVMVTVSLF